MRPPYSLICVSHGCLVAGRGASLGLFDLETCRHSSSWNLIEGKSGNTGQIGIAPEAKGESSETLGDGADAAISTQEPPSKRRRLSVPEEAAGNGDSKPKGPEGASRRADKAAAETQTQRAPQSRALERLAITAMRITPDGRHVVTVTALDKTVRVFELAEPAALKLLSERTMPKRPSSIAIAFDGETILVADKFGDVYALPLIPSAQPEQPVSHKPSAPNASGLPYSPQADLSTVHTARNRRALEYQLMQMQQRQQQKEQQEDTDTTNGHTPQPQHGHPIVGHVSMLTAVLTAQDDHGRPYILTADRDEHIRVSRGTLAQAHVIEAFCLGHRHFVSRLCIPRPEVLVSGGGDDDLYVWDWRAGRLLATSALLPHVQAVVPLAKKLAVSGLYACSVRLPGNGEDDTQDACAIAVFCERVPALFFFRLSASNQLEYAMTLGLPSNPLDLVVLGETGAGRRRRFLVALDANGSGDQTESKDNAMSGDNIFVVEEDETSYLKLQGGMKLGAAKLGDGGADWTREEIEALLYTTEGLRKTIFEDARENDD